MLRHPKLKRTSIDWVEGRRTIAELQRLNPGLDESNWTSAFADSGGVINYSDEYRELHFAYWLQKVSAARARRQRHA
jgi:hypothetical protein